MGERLGHCFVDAEEPVDHRRGYQASPVVGVQPERADVLLDDTAGGTPQRFVWLPTTYPHQDERPSEPPVLCWQLPSMDTSGTYSLPICLAAAQEIDAAHLRRARGEGDPLDGHMLLTREKVAAALGLLQGHVEIVEEDWQLAGVVMDVSATTRAGVVVTLAAVRERAEEARIRHRVKTERAVDDDSHARAFATAQRQAVNHIAKHAGSEGCRRRCITQAIAGKYRVGVSIDEVISDALAREYLSSSSDGETYFPGKRTP